MTEYVRPTPWLDAFAAGYNRALAEDVGSDLALNAFEEGGSLRPALAHPLDAPWLADPVTADALGYFAAIGQCQYGEARAAEKGAGRLRWQRLRVDEVASDMHVSDAIADAFLVGRQAAWPWRGFDHPGVLNTADRLGMEWRQGSRSLTGVSYNWMRATSFFSTIGYAEVDAASDPVQELWRMENEARDARRSHDEPR